ncbi:MAG TPA: WecB/TagA/CpsF family glycosyltransferase [Anaerolineae bacterium]|nr:WecB/TagA/CpsF family glycosyltransferase [Anaerolineae bacterium]HMR67926.1 WecB/TagA/CpsF family glycosyltransferase [Anaerolineae bacterium]
MPALNLPQVNILGVGINAITLPQAVAQIAGWIESHGRQYVSVCNVHTIMECQHHEAMRQAVNGAGLATPDGMPLVWLGRWLTQLEVSRVYGPDLMLALCELSAERGYSHYFCGGALGVPELLAERLQAKFPKLRVAGTYSPPFHPLSPAEESQLIECINQANPDIIWVGLGTPKQDLWMARYRERLNAPVLIAVGAAFDFFSGRVPQAPRWMQRSGLEWFYRLLQEPQRLWYRYLVYNPWFVTLLVAQGLGLKHYPLPSQSLPPAQTVARSHSVSD